MPEWYFGRIAHVYREWLSLNDIYVYKSYYVSREYYGNENVTIYYITLEIPDEFVSLFLLRFPEIELL
jgi:hypothetical protein